MAGTSNSGGRNAKAPSEHMATGTYRPDRHEGFDAPDPPKGRPVAPKSLVDPVARAEWERMVDRMEQSHTLALVDDAALYQHAQLFSETERIIVRSIEDRKLAVKLTRTALKELKGDALVGAIEAIERLRAQERKDTRDLRQGHMAIRSYLVEFGMTPAARTRVKIQKSDKKPSKLLAFMGGKANA